MVPPSDAHRDQTDAFCDELNRRIAELDNRAIRLKARMAKYVVEKRPAQIERLQSQSIATAVERRKLIEMLIDLGHNHPCDHGTVG